MSAEKPFLQLLMEFRSPAPQKGLGESLSPETSTVTYSSFNIYIMNVSFILFYYQNIHI